MGKGPSISALKFPLCPSFSATCAQIIPGLLHPPRLLQAPEPKTRGAPDASHAQTHMHSGPWSSAVQLTVCYPLGSQVPTQTPPGLLPRPHVWLTPESHAWPTSLVHTPSWLPSTLRCWREGPIAPCWPGGPALVCRAHWRPGSLGGSRRRDFRSRYLALAHSIQRLLDHRESLFLKVRSSLPLTSASARQGPQRLLLVASQKTAASANGLRPPPVLL